MLWVDQGKLTAAASALADVAASLMTAGSRMKIVHPTKNFDKDKWEAIICSALSAHGYGPDAILPEGSHHLAQDHRNGSLHSCPGFDIRSPRENVVGG